MVHLGRGVLVERSGREWGKVYLAKPILDAVECPETTEPEE